MKKLSMIGIVGGAALLAAVPLSLQWSQVGPAVPLLTVSHANAQYYGPSRRHVRRVYRRAYRRAYGGYPSSYPSSYPSPYPSPYPSSYGGYPSCLGQYPFYFSVWHCPLPKAISSCFPPDAEGGERVSLAANPPQL